MRSSQNSGSDSADGLAGEGDSPFFSEGLSPCSSLFDLFPRNRLFSCHHSREQRDGISVTL